MGNVISCGDIEDMVHDDQGIIDCVDDAVVFLNNKCCIVFSNNAAENILRLEGGGLVGCNINNYKNKNSCNNNSIAEVLFNSMCINIEKSTDIKASIGWKIGFYNKVKKSKCRYEIKVFPFSNNFVVDGYVVTIVDVSQRVRCDARLRISKLLNHGVLETSQDPIFTLNSKMSIINMNSTARRLFATSFKTINNKLLDDVVEVCDVDDDFYILPEAIRHKRNNKTLEISALCNQGERRTFDISISLIAGLKYKFYTAIFHDITDRKKVESKLNDQLMKANKDNEAKSTFLAIMSHEMRTPLIGVLGVHEILADMDLSEEQARYLEIANLSSRSLLNIINGVLDFSKIEAGKLELEMQTFNPEDIVNQVVEILAETSFKKGVAIQSYISADTPVRLVNDPVRLHQVLINLVGNAIKFTDAGGISVFVKKSPTPNKIIFEVNDTGIGIPSDKLPILFDEFTQAESSTTRRYGGTGLGLAISKRIVHLLGGQLLVSSKEGLGSKFWFELNVDVNDLSEFYQPPPGIHGTRILLVDKSSLSASNLKGQLEAFSMMVTTTSNLLQAQELLVNTVNSDEKYNIVIVNLFGLSDDIDKFCRVTTEIQYYKGSSFLLIGPHDCLRQVKSRYDSIFTSAIPLPIRRTTLLNRINLLLEEGVDNYTPPSEKINLFPVCKNNMRVLVVDDSATNRIVTETMLNRAGYNTYVAENGKDAITILRGNMIDLVLMDLSMPVMDGIEATVFIRTLSALKQIPIIAMTATALQEEIDACLHAGMNDYLEKPFTKQSLLEKLAVWDSKITASTSLNDIAFSQPDQDSIVETDDTVVDEASYIDFGVLSQMSDDLPDGMLLDMVDVFFSESVKRLEQINCLLNAGEMSELGKQAHALKGSAATFGARLLSPLAADLERNCKQNNTDASIAVANELLEVGQTTLDFFQRHFSIKNTPSSALKSTDSS